MRVVVSPFHPGLSFPPIEADSVQVLRLCLNNELAEWATRRGVLSGEERDRAGRYQIERPRQQFIAVRTVLRLLLAARLGANPTELRFHPSPDGKPILVGAPSELEFNVSHTDGMGLITVAPVAVGVDIESVRPRVAVDELVSRYFARSEIDQYAVLPSGLRLASFYKGWVCKEAILKGVGCGTRGLEGCVVDLDPRLPGRIIDLSGPAAERGLNWSVAVWEPIVGSFAAIAAQCDRLEMHHHNDTVDNSPPCRS